MEELISNMNTNKITKIRVCVVWFILSHSVRDKFTIRTNVANLPQKTASLPEKEKKVKRQNNKTVKPQMGINGMERHSVGVIVRCVTQTGHQQPNLGL